MTLTKRIILICVLFLALFSLVVIGLWDKYTVPILVYHSVNVSDQGNLNVVSPQRFSRQMDFLKRHGYKVISLSALVDAIKQNKSLSHKSVVITFDDGYADNYEQAFAVLKKHNFPATIFVSAEQIDTAGYLSWNHIQEMKKYDITIGSHLLDQTYLPGVDEKEQYRQIRKSKIILERNARYPVEFLSYPSGGFTQKVKEILQLSGYRAACTTNRGHDRFNKDVYELKRIRMGNADNSPVILWAKLSGYYNLLRKPKNPY